MGVGSVATRLLADFGAEVIKIEDRTRIDTPRKLPIYKDEPARNFGEETIDADPDRGGLFNNYCRNKLGVVINMRTPKGRAAGRAPDRREQRRLGELRPRRDGALGPHLRAPPGAVARRHLRPDERLRALRPARRVPQLRAGRAGGERAHLHQRPARPGAVGLGPLVHGQPGRLLQLDRAADGDLPAHAHRAGHRDRRVGDRERHQPRRAGAARRHRQRAHDAPTRLPDRQPARVAARRAARRLPGARRRTVGSPSPCSTTSSGPVWSTRSDRPAWTADPRFATQEDRFANQDALDEHVAGLDA